MSKKKKETNNGSITIDTKYQEENKKLKQFEYLTRISTHNKVLNWIKETKIIPNSTRRFERFQNGNQFKVTFLGFEPDFDEPSSNSFYGNLGLLIPVKDVFMKKDVRVFYYHTAKYRKEVAYVMVVTAKTDEELKNIKDENNNTLFSKLYKFDEFSNKIVDSKYLKTSKYYWGCHYEFAVDFEIEIQNPPQLFVTTKIGEGMTELQTFLVVCNRLFSMFEKITVLKKEINENGPEKFKTIDDITTENIKDFIFYTSTQKYTEDDIKDIKGSAMVICDFNLDYFQSFLTIQFFVEAGKFHKINGKFYTFEYLKKIGYNFRLIDKMIQELGNKLKIFEFLEWLFEKNITEPHKESLQWFHYVLSVQKNGISKISELFDWGNNQKEVKIIVYDWEKIMSKYINRLNSQHLK